MKKITVLISVFSLLLLLSACLKYSHTEPSSSPFPTSVISGDEAVITPDISSEVIDTKLVELEPASEPNKLEDNGESGFIFFDADEFFSLFDYVVYVKIAGWQEIRYDRTYGNGNTASFYATILDAEVIKSYGNKELTNIKDGIIKISYDNSSYNFMKTAANLDIGTECILVLADTTKIRDNFKSDFIDYAPYYIFGKNECVIENTEQGFNALGLMSLAQGKEYSYFTDDERAAEYYTLTEVEYVINQNIDKLKGLEYRKFLENYYAMRSPD